MLGTPFQFGKPIQFSSGTPDTALAGWKRASPQHARRIEAFRPSQQIESSHAGTKPCVNLYSMSGHRLAASDNSILAHGWLTYAPVTIVPGSSASKAGSGKNMSITLRPRDTNAQPSLERLLPATYQSARVREVSVGTAQVSIHHP